MFEKASIFAIACLFFAVWWWSYYKREPFVPDPAHSDLIRENTDNNPWNHHPVQESLPLNHRIRYPQAFYYELDNAAFQEAFDRAFHISTSSPWYRAALKTNEWLGPYSPSDADVSWKDGYASFFAYVQATLRSSPEFCLPGTIRDASKDTSVELQIVHDRWRRFFVWNKTPNVIRIDVELLLYREGKYQGKHMLVFAVLEQTRPGHVEVHIVQANVVGVVPSDGIGMHPVLPIDKEAVQEASWNTDPFSFSPHILISDQEVLSEITRKKDNLKKNALASQATGQYLTSYEVVQDDTTAQGN